MSVPSGVFTHPTTSGRLQVLFSGIWLVNEADWGSGDWDIVIRCTVGEGSSRKTAIINSRNCTATIEMPYSAGQFVPVSMEYVSHTFGGAGTIHAKDLSIKCHLLQQPYRPRIVRFSDLLQQLYDQLQPMSTTVQTPRWMPDSEGNQWFVRPLAAMATNQITDDPRFTALDTTAVGYDEGDQATWTTAANHPLAPPGAGSIRVRDANPIDPASISVVGYPSWNFTGTPQQMTATLLTDSTSVPGETLYYIRATNGPGLYAYSAGQGQFIFQGTALFSWRYADLAALDGTSYETAWPGLNAIDWDLVQPGDTIWICGTHNNEVLNVNKSGVPGAYIKIRLDYPTDYGTIIQAQPFPSPWELVGSQEWKTSLPNVTEVAVFEGEARLSGITVNSKCRVRIEAIDPVNDTIVFRNIRPIYTGHLIEIGSDYVVSEALPVGLTPNTAYYAIWVAGVQPFFSVTPTVWTVKLAATYEDALAGIAVDIQSGLGTRNAFVFITDTGYPFYDPRPGALGPGQYAIDPIAQELYYRPSIDGAHPDSMNLRWSADTYSGTAAAILGIGVSYIKVLGGGEYGGIFGVAPKGRVVMSHQNLVQFENGTDIVIDGLEIKACRSAVLFSGITRGTVRNCRQDDIAHHGCGGENLQTIEPYLLLERNWITRVGLLHDFGDFQGTVTNPNCDNSIMRRNLIQRIGRNTRVCSPSCAVYDSSDDMYVYLNWHDDFVGRSIELMAGPEGTTNNAVVSSNIVTRMNASFERDENQIQRNGFIISSIVNNSDPGVSNARVFGNLVAQSKIGNIVPGTGDISGLVYLRKANTVSPDDISLFSHNAILYVDGPLFSRQINGTGALPTIFSDENLYCATPEFAINVDDGVITQSWSGAQIQGEVAGFWSYDTGNDANSEFAVMDPSDVPAEPTVAQLEILRKWDAYDTDQAPTLAMIGGFPFIGV